MQHLFYSCRVVRAAAASAMVLHFIETTKKMLAPPIRHRELQTHCTLTSNITPDLSLLFQGEASRYSIRCEQATVTELHRFAPDSVDIVVAYCKSDLNWIYDDLIGQIPNQMNVRITVLSKCGEEAHIPLFTNHPLVVSLNTIQVPNVGGCDYAYTHYINNYIYDTSPSIVTLFTKDTARDNDHFHFRYHKGYRNVSRMIDIASKGEFACGIEPQADYSWYHETETLYNFNLKSYTRVSERRKLNEAQFNGLEFNRYNILGMKEFHTKFLNYSFPQQFTPVCYGGSFAVPTQNIVNFLRNGGEEVLKNVECHLAQGVAVAEEHFTERSWAGFFSDQLLSSQIEALQTRMKHIVKKKKSVNGMVALKG
jgi:hypothetical protein